MRAIELDPGAAGSSSPEVLSAVPFKNRLPLGRARQHYSPSQATRAAHHALSGPADFGDTGVYSPVRLLLARHVADSPGPNLAITLLRGAQTGFASHGWHLDLPNLPFSVGPGLTTTPFTPTVAAKVRANMANPLRAAALTTALFSGLVTSELPRLMRVDFDAEATTLRGTEVTSLLAVPGAGATDPAREPDLPHATSTGARRPP